MGLEFVEKGNFKHTESFLKRLTRKEFYKDLERFAREGADALAAATPRDTGKTAESWSYEIVTTGDSTSISWNNDNYISGYYYSSTDGATPIVILIRHGHATANGGYIPPNDFVTPTISKIMDKAADKVWTEVTRK